MVLCLKKYCPDLSLVSVATKATGLGLVTGLSPGNQVLQDNYERILAEFVPPGYDDVVSQESEVLNIIANDVRLITDWLREHRPRAAS